MIQVLQFPTMSIRQARKAPKLTSDGQVAPFDMRSRNIARIGPSILDDWDSSRYPAHGTVPVRPRNVGAAVDLDKLRVVSAAREVVFDRSNVPAQPVRRKLESPVNPFAQIADKRIGAIAVAPSDVEGDDHLGYAVERDPDILIASLCRSVRPKPALMATNVGPDFVSLDKLSVNATYAGIPELAAFASSSFEQGKNRGLVQPSKPGNSANANAFEHQRKSFCRNVRRGVVRAEGLRSTGIGKGRVTGSAAPALDSALAVSPEFLSSTVVTSDAGHGFSPLDFCGEKPHTHFGSGVRLTPRFGLAPQPVSAGSGALIVNYVLGWWLDRYLYGLTGSECDLDSDSHAAFILPESPVPAGLSYLRPKSLALRRGPKSALARATEGRFKRMLGCHLVQKRHSTHVRSSVCGSLRFQNARHHSAERGSNRREGISFVFSEVKSLFCQVIANIRRREPLAFMGREYQSDCVLKSGILCFHLFNRTSIRFLLLFGKQGKDREDQLSELRYFQFGFIALFRQFGAALH